MIILILFDPLGSFLGGTANAILWLEETYYQLLHDYLQAGFFVGKDQSLFNALMFNQPERFLTYLVYDPTEPYCYPTKTGCGDYWYYYQFMFATNKERSIMKSKNFWDKPDPWNCLIPQVMTFWELHKKVYNIEVQN